MPIDKEITNHGVVHRDSENGRFAPGVADGKTNIPTPSDMPSSSTSTQGTNEDSLQDIATAYQKAMERQEENRVREQILTNEFYRILAGSQLAGVATATSDRDEIGIYIESLEQMIGLESSKESYQIRSAAVGTRSQLGDIDLTVYSLRKYMRLATDGNPSLLAPLFAPVDLILKTSVIAEELRELAPAIVSARAGWKHLGYLNGQRQRFVGEGQQRRVPNRPELIEEFGYDCYLDDTEFLTRRGWLTYEKIHNEELGTINPKTGQVEYQNFTERISKPYTGQIIHSKTRYSEWAVTPNHRMFVSKVERGNGGINGDEYRSEVANWGFRRADEVTTLSWHQRVAPATRDVEYAISDAYLSLIGAYVAEGCVGKRLKAGGLSVLRFEQKDGGRLHEIMDLIEVEFPLRRYRYPEKRLVTIFSLADRAIAKEVALTCGEGSVNKHLPTWYTNLSSRQSGILLKALLAGDGTPYRTGGWIYYTVSPQLAQEVQILAMIAGKGTLAWGPYSLPHPTNSEHGMNQIFIQDLGVEFRMFNTKSIKVLNVVDRKIVCFTVPNEMLVTRRNGRIAMHGNTKYAAHALRLGLQGIEIMENGRLYLPMTPENLASVRSVRLGEVDYEEALNRIDKTSDRLKDILDNKRYNLPLTPNYPLINKWMVSVVTKYWKEK